MCVFCYTSPRACSFRAIALPWNQVWKSVVKGATDWTLYVTSSAGYFFYKSVFPVDGLLKNLMDGVVRSFSGSIYARFWASNISKPPASKLVGRVREYVIASSIAVFVHTLFWTAVGIAERFCSAPLGCLQKVSKQRQRLLDSVPIWPWRTS